MKKEKFDQLFLNLIQNDGDYFPVLYGKKVTCIQDFVYPSDITPLRPGIGKNGKKMPNGPQYIVIHDTGMTNDTDDAVGLNKYIHAQANKKDGRVASWHFSIDDSSCYQHVPTNEIAWHAGDGSNPYLSFYYNSNYKKECIGGGNQNGIGIETCINPKNDYEMTLKRTARLVAQLLHEYNLNSSRIKQHYDFSGKECPNVIRNTNGLWESFMLDVELEYKLIKIDPNATLHWTIDLPDVINYNGKKTIPDKDIKVNLQLNILSENDSFSYHYNVFVKGVHIQDISKKINKNYISDKVSYIDGEFALSSDKETSTLLKNKFTKNIVPKIKKIE